MRYLFQLGREPLLSTAEIQAVFSSLNLKPASRQAGKQWLILETDRPLDAIALMQRLGGTIKIGEKIMPSTSPLETIIAHLEGVQITGKINFSLNNKELALKVKKELKARGRNVRYIELKNTATILHNDLVAKQGDLTIVSADIFVTRAIQPFQELSERDFGRPGFDAKSGMLPPKLARIMINLAQMPEDATIMDPFCGSGTILTEAASMGFTKLFGGDISLKSIDNTKQNLEWIKKTYHVSHITYQLFVCDARSIDEKLKPACVDTIVTEPYLGQPLRGRESESFIHKQAEELKKLYGSALQTFTKILKPHGSIVMVVPSFLMGRQTITIDLALAIKKAGLTVSPLIPYHVSLRYHRPNQHVAREIWRLVKK